ADLEYVFGALPGLPSKAHVGLATLAMGDVNACEYAQASHLGVLYCGDVFSPAELLCLNAPVPREPCMVGVIIDDLIVLERLVATCVPGPPGLEPHTMADSRMALADEAYAKANLISNPSKGFQNEAHSKFWGVECDGDRGMVRPSRTRLWPLIAVSVRVASLGVATVGLLKTLCGSWTSVVLLRRRVLSIMSLLFAAADSGDLDDIVRLSPELRSELWCLVCLGPLICVDLRAEAADFISATDASTWGGAGVRAQVPKQVVLELCRHSLCKGTWTHLLPPGHAWLREHDRLDPNEELPGTGHFEPNLLATVLATRLPYKERWRKQYHGPEHINRKEVRAYLQEESFAARAGSRLRLLTGALNVLLESSLGPYLGCGMYPHFLYYLSEFNPSDGPTRGEFAEFDAWMAKVGALRLALSLGPPKTELWMARRQFSFLGSAPDLALAGALDLYAGHGGVSRALLQLGAPWVISYDLLRSPDQNLLDVQAQARIEELVLARRVRTVGMAPPCCSFSSAVTPPVRSSRFPRGVPWLAGAMKERVGEGNKHADWCAKLIGLCEKAGVGWWLEQPDTSGLWRLPGFKLFRKRTRVACSSELDSWTAVAQPYPKEFAKTLALAAAREAGGVCAWTSLAVLAAELDALERLWEDFESWCRRRLSDSCLVFSLCPVLAAMALRAYGNFCFSAGKTLSGFRHTIIAAQRRVLGSKPFLHLAWEMVTRWEALEPPVHRCPVPEPMLKAIVFLADCWGMCRWASIALLSFYGLARVGEVLRCRRSDLLFPSDLLDDEAGGIFLNFKESKTAARGRPRIQHTKVTDPAARIWLTRALEHVPRDQLLWPGSPGAFRYRWDLLLRHLCIPKELALTPGGLRGGGAVQRYRSGMSPSDLQWLMRLKNFGTLEHYLQELSAVSALTEVSSAGRDRIRTAAALYDATAARLTARSGLSG
ncbi:unnamed protein product, partial [Symbiodinium sp. KB8]